MKIEEIRELINTKKAEARGLLDKDLEKAEKITNEVRELQKKLDLATELEEEEKRDLQQQKENEKRGNLDMVKVNEMRSAVKYALGKEMTQEERAIIKTTDNTALIPEEILKEIEVKKGFKSLKNLCNVRTVNASNGTIPVVDLDQNELKDVLEGDDLVDGTLVSTDVSYKCSNVGLIQQLSNDLVDDAVVEIEGLVKNNFVNIASIKENKKILDCVDKNATTVKATDYNDVEKIVAESLPSNKANLVILVNPKAYATLACAKDKQGRSLNIMTNINGQEYAFGCPIHAFDNGLVTGTDTKELYYVLDMKEAVQYIERKGITILKDTNIRKMGAPIVAIGEKMDVVKGSARSVKKILIGATV
ncbi:phage major capsid protein [Clostridium tetani]|uniref:Phage major capsid protein n=1 Tax=Clostridium tetani TaxID=1513 RepID=A0ABY0EQQ6_CLOTA|nr:phage major capsid protein [Clostridium tetani]RXI57418.1 phage major capsid protein [Clostridium tetani]RXI66996.1 phage major capsid protein [Clostridium tetani]